MYRIRQTVLNHVNSQCRQLSTIAPLKGKPFFKSQVLPFMLQILKSHTTLILVQVARQLVNHSHIIKDHTDKTWINGEKIGLCVMTNHVGDAHFLCSALYDPNNLEFFKNIYLPSSPDVIFLEYYKITVSHQDFGQLPGTNNKPKKWLLACF